MELAVGKRLVKPFPVPRAQWLRNQEVQIVSDRLIGGVAVDILERRAPVPNDPALVDVHDASLIHMGTLRARPGVSKAERRRNRTFQPVGCMGLPVLKSVALRRAQALSAWLWGRWFAEFV